MVGPWSLASQTNAAKSAQARASLDSATTTRVHDGTEFSSDFRILDQRQLSLRGMIKVRRPLGRVGQHRNVASCCSSNKKTRYPIFSTPYSRKREHTPTVIPPQGGTHSSGANPASNRQNRSTTTPPPTSTAWFPPSGGMTTRRWRWRAQPPPPDQTALSSSPRMASIMASVETAVMPGCMKSAVRLPEASTASIAVSIMSASSDMSKE